MEIINKSGIIEIVQKLYCLHHIHHLQLNYKLLVLPRIDASAWIVATE